MEVSGHLHAAATLPPRKSPPGNHWIGEWVRSKTGLDAVAKRKIPFPPLPGRESQSSSPQSSVYNDSATPTLVVSFIHVPFSGFSWAFSKTFQSLPLIFCVHYFSGASHLHSQPISSSCISVL